MSHFKHRSGQTLKLGKCVTGLISLTLILLAPMAIAQNSRDHEKNDFALQVKTQKKICLSQIIL
jgi:hypothetical protein